MTEQDKKNIKKLRKGDIMADGKKLNISYVDTSILLPAAYNPRTWDETAVAKLKDSIERFGLVDPLIVNNASNRKNIIIGGHFRFEIAKRLGIEKIPVVYVNIPDINKEKELNLRLNRNTGQWDFDLLKSFDIELLLDVGFDDSDLAGIWDEHLAVEDDEFNTDDELSKIKEIQTKPGDIYKLGSHLLGCGDALDFNFLDKLIEGSQIDMVYMDPPFNISLDYNNGIGTKGKYGGYLTKDNKSESEYRDFLTRALQNALRKTKIDSHVFCYCDESYIGLIQETYKQLEIDNKRVCLWIKNNSNLTPQVAFNKVYEPCIYGTRGKPYLQDKLSNLNQILNKEVESGNRALDDIYDMLSIWLVKRLATASYEHPTEKPPTLHEKPIRRCTRVGDKILDLFGGSGSTLIACEQLKRTCFIADLEPIFCDLIIKRYKNLTGKEEVRAN
jgi:DNA modification methylase